MTGTYHSPGLTPLQNLCRRMGGIQLHSDGIANPLDSFLLACGDMLHLLAEFPEQIRSKAVAGDSLSRQPEYGSEVTFA
jgi:hypothetical protein